MVLGLRTKSRRGTTIQVGYIIYVQEIKPWPPSHSLRSLRNVLLQWENGERTSGSIGPVVPSIGSVVGDGKIEFNESIKLSVALSRELSARGGNVSSFQKNCLELNLYEPRRDKSNKGQHLASATVNLAEYSTIKGSANLRIPMNCKRSFRNMAQPAIFLKIQLSEKEKNTSSLRKNLSNEVPLDSKESVSALMSEEYAEEEAEIDSFTDNDVSSHSSLTIPSNMDATASSLSENGSVDERILPEHNDSERMEDNSGRESSARDLLSGSNPAKPALNLGSDMDDHGRFSSHSSSFNLSGDILGQGTRDFSFTQESTSMANQNGKSDLHQKSCVQVINSGSSDNNNDGLPSMKEDEVEDINGKAKSVQNDPIVKDLTIPASDANSNVLEGREEIEAVDDTHQKSEDEDMPDRGTENSGENIKESGSNQVEVARGEDIPLNSSASFVKSNGLKNNTSTGTSLKNLNFIEGNESDFVESTHGYSRSMLLNKVRSDRRSKNFPPGKVKWLTKDINNQTSHSKIGQLEQRVEFLEGELQEAASLELSLYSIVAEHGSSTQKVHAPARRLSRLYTHALKQCHRERRGSSAKSIVSGLVLVSKACGHDVPSYVTVLAQLTFWLSNSIVLRTIITQLVDDFPHCALNESSVKTNGFQKEAEKKVHPLKWNSTSDDRTRELSPSEEKGKWEDPCTFISMLEKIEGWIFSRIIESIWWQTLTPHMQSPISNELKNQQSMKKNGGKPGLCDQQGNFSISLWKKAFNESCERICPVRAAGHECGCLSVLARLVMEQCVNRLDVAMFNAILRESDDDIPTDPVSDPIGDSIVLPIPSGKTSFGAGAQLKNAIGHWSRWLTDLFGIDDDDSFEDNEELNYRDDPSRSFKSFHLLNALSDLLMLPKSMLLDRSIWREVCPTFGAPMIKRILDTFVLDEFYSEPIPESLFEALESEDSLDDTEELINNFPCDAVPVIYKPPSTAAISKIIGDVHGLSHLRRSGSSVLRKGQTSDDELEELELPLTSIFVDTRHTPGSTWKLKGANNVNVVRFELLRDVWKNGD